MSHDQFQLVYDGPIVREGSMDVYDLAPALLSVGDLVREVNRFLNEDRSTVNVQVRSDFRRGSFEVFLVVNHALVEEATQTLFSGVPLDAKALVELIFGHAGAITTATGAVIGLIKLYKLMRGEAPKRSAIRYEDNSTTVINNINVEGHTAALYMNDSVLNTMDRMMRPLAKAGIDELQIRKDSVVVDRVSKDDLPQRLTESSDNRLSERILSDSREALLKVVKANFEKGKWTFSDGTAKFNADIKDPVFKRRLDNKEIGFYKGDVLLVRLQTVQRIKGDGQIRSQYLIQEVLEHRPVPTQRELGPGKPVRRFRKIDS